MRKQSWKVDACSPGWVRVHDGVAQNMHGLGAEVRTFDGGKKVGRFPLVRVWAVDLYGQRGKFGPDYDEYGSGRIKKAEYARLRAEHSERCVGAVLRACRGFAEEPARALMVAAFAAYALGGPDAVEQAMQAVPGG
jgi:hypothetical protein